MGDKVNELLDNLDAVVWRLYEFPIAFLLFCALAAGLLAWLLASTLARRRGRRLPWAAPGLIVLVVLQLLLALVTDRRNLLLQGELLRLRENAAAAGAGAAPAGIAPPTREGAFDPAAPNQDIPPMLRDLPRFWTTAFRWKWWRLDVGVDYYRFSLPAPLAVVHLAVVDLDAGHYQVVLPREVDKKTLTTDFARREEAFVAVNGEAGMTSGLNAKLGDWKGNYIVRGEPVYLDDSDQRPFLSFDRDGVGRYFPDAVVDRANSPEKYNTIWGRYDLLVDGKIRIDRRDDSKDMRYSRTILGIARKGKRVYLMVVDGKAPGYSMGLTMKECGKILLGMGCREAMACDQGGSSCMYVRGLGLASRPTSGIERPVYTHFGIRTRKE